MKAAQVAGTEIGLNWLGWFVCTEKAPVMAVQPTTDLGERFSKQRLAAMIDDTPALRALIQPARCATRATRRRSRNGPAACW